MNLLEPQADNIAMRIKHILQIQQKTNTPTWENIATYWLTLDLNKISKRYQFLMSNNRINQLTGINPSTTTILFTISKTKIPKYKKYKTQQQKIYMKKS